MREKAKCAVPLIKAYHDHLFATSKGTSVPANTLLAMVEIAPEDEGVQRQVLKLVSASDNLIRKFGERDFRERTETSRKVVLDLMHILPIEDKIKLQPLLAGFVTTADPLIIQHIGKLDIENKAKLPALITALSAKSTCRALIITEIAKLGADAKAALPILKSLKTDPDGAVRTAATAAVEAIKE